MIYLPKGFWERILFGHGRMIFIVFIIHRNDIIEISVFQIAYIDNNKVFFMEKKSPSLGYRIPIAINMVGLCYESWFHFKWVYSTIVW
ncbi:hypothetical protein V8C37DRAFT_42904 [Trichoderma ceciliae]